MITLERVHPGRASAVEAVVDQIRRHLAVGDLAAGDPMPPERLMAEQLGVSRRVVREAIAALAQMGVVEVRQGVGSFIASDTSRLVAGPLEWSMVFEAKDIAGLYQVRRFLETEAAALAAQNRTAEDLVELKRALDLTRATVGTAHADWVDHDLEFHHKIARVTGNAVLVALYRPMLEIVRHLVVFLQGDAYQRASVDELERIYEAIARGDADSAREAMSLHLDHSVVLFDGVSGSGEQATEHSR